MLHRLQRVRARRKEERRRLVSIASFTQLNIVSHGPFSDLQKHPLFWHITHKDWCTGIFPQSTIQMKKTPTISDLHLCKGRKTRLFSCLKWNLTLVASACLSNEAGINFVSTGVSAACTSKHMHINPHKCSCIDEQWQQEQKKKTKRVLKYCSSHFKSKSLWLQWSWCNLHQLRICSCIYFRKDAILS